MSRRAQLAIKQVVRKLKRYKPERVILFGSYAWGHPEPWSDLDLFVIKRPTKGQSMQTDELNKALYPRPMDMPIDLLVYTPQQVRGRLLMGDTFVGYVLEHGKVIYERRKTKRARA